MCSSISNRLTISAAKPLLPILRMKVKTKRKFDKILICVSVSVILSYTIWMYEKYTLLLLPRSCSVERLMCSSIYLLIPENLHVIRATYIKQNILYSSNSSREQHCHWSSYILGTFSVCAGGACTSRAYPGGPCTYEPCTNERYTNEFSILFDTILRFVLKHIQMDFRAFSHGYCAHCIVWRKSHESQK